MMIDDAEALALAREMARRLKAMTWCSDAVALADDFEAVLRRRERELKE